MEVVPEVPEVPETSRAAVGARNHPATFRAAGVHQARLESKGWHAPQLWSFLASVRLHLPQSRQL